MALFRFIAQDKLVNIAKGVIGANPAFMNTQLFFNPHNSNQKNYWHRDIQYTGMSVEEQKGKLTTNNILHFRVPLADEPGIELIPGSHTAWDNADEFDVRMEQNDRKNHEALPNGKTIPLKRGDLLVFSANMIHRGLYGKDRFALDIILCDPDPALLKFVDQSCLPAATELGLLARPAIYFATLEALSFSS